VEVKANNLLRQYEMHRDEYEEAALRTLRSGWYVLGGEVGAFEDEFAAYLDVKNCVGVASGLDALILGFRALGIGAGDEVIVASNAYIACVMGITINGATPIFVEPDESYNIDASKIEEALTERTKAILAVHLYGRACDMDPILKIAAKHGLYVAEDCAQAHGTTYRGQKTGTFGNIGCFSFYPTKGLGGFGDGGALVTNDERISDRVRQLRNYGSSRKYIFNEVGMNSRLDELQAALLRVKLGYLDDINRERTQIAHNYFLKINHPEIQLPENVPGHTYHQFVIRIKNRDGLKSYLQSRGIGSEIHYPIPPHLSEAYAGLGYREGDFPISEELAAEVLSIPIYNGYREEEQAYVIETLNAWDGK
jgi:dTDP-4-amino-4,6-dideoxygalactose transaminase